MDIMSFKKAIDNMFIRRRSKFHKGTMVIIDDKKNIEFYDKLFFMDDCNIWKDVEDNRNFKSGINFIAKDIVCKRDGVLLRLIKEHKSKVNFVIYGLSELCNQLYNEESELLKELKGLSIGLIFILNNCERFSLEDLVFHKQYLTNEFEIKSFLTVGTEDITTKDLNQYEDICNYLYENIGDDFKINFALEQSIDLELKKSYLKKELIECYEELILNNSEDLKSIEIIEVYNILEFIKDELLNFYDFCDKDLELNNIKKGVFENLINKEFSTNIINKLKTNSFGENSNMVALADHYEDHIIKNFLSTKKSIDTRLNDSQNEELGVTEIMYLDNTEVMEVDLNSELMIDFVDSEKENANISNNEKGGEQESKRKLSIINMSENRIFKEVEIIGNYGINEEFIFEEEESHTPLAEVKDIDDKLKEVIWTNDETATSDLVEYELIEGSQKKYKKINMNGNDYN